MSSSTPPVNLTFGVPLEDVFPNGAVHPSLKNLFKKIKETVGIQPKTLLKNIKRSDVIPTDHESYLEECVTLCKPLDDFIPAESLMWILRHFLGSLPIPLMPRYTNSTYFIWRKYSQRCKIMIEHYLELKLNNELLIDKISDELMKLPQVNLLLVVYVVNLFRALTIKSDRKGIKINKSSALILVRYFGGSIFVRPFTGRTEAKHGEIYHHLLLYLTMKWPQIERRCVQKHPNSFTPGTRNTNTTVASSSRRFNLETIPEETISVINYVTRSVGNSTSTDSPIETVRTKECSSQTLFISYRNASSQTSIKDIIELPTPSCSRCDSFNKDDPEKFKIKILSPIPSKRSWFTTDEISSPQSASTPTSYTDDSGTPLHGKKPKKLSTFGKILSKIGLKKNSGGDHEDEQGDSNVRYRKMHSSSSKM